VHSFRDVERNRDAASPQLPREVFVFNSMRRTTSRNCRNTSMITG
jgi:hypothetical protein